MSFTACYILSCVSYRVTNEMFWSVENRTFKYWDCLICIIIVFMLYLLLILFLTTCSCFESEGSVWCKCCVVIIFIISMMGLVWMMLLLHFLQHMWHGCWELALELTMIMLVLLQIVSEHWSKILGHFRALYVTGHLWEIMTWMWMLVICSVKMVGQFIVLCTVVQECWKHVQTHS
jgi:hypothetical protein